MTIDCNVTLGHWPFHPLRHNTPEAFLGLMDREGIGRAWVAPFEAVFYKGVQPANRDLAAALTGHGDRLLQIAVIDPAFPGWEDDLAECADLGLRGVRLYPSYHGYDAQHPGLLRLLEIVAAAGGFVQIVTRIQDERLHHPLAQVPPVDVQGVARLAAGMPELPMTLLNAATAEVAAALKTASPSNLTFDISHVDGLGAVGKLARSVGAERLLFGSHAPFFIPRSAVLKMVEADLTPEQRMAVLQGNAERIGAQR